MPLTKWIAAVTRLFKRHPTAGSALLYGIVIVTLFPEVTFKGRVFFERDVHVFWWTQIQTFVRVVTSPAWPLWDPYGASGQSLLADTGSEVFYPPMWLNLLVLPGTYFTLFTLGHFLFSGLGMRALGRALGLSQGAALTAGAMWIASGPFLSLAGIWHHQAGAAWLPWLLWAVERACRRARAREVLLLSGVATGMLLAGSPDMCTFGAIGATALALRHVLRRPWRAAAWLGLRLVAAALLAAALTGAMWLPAAEAITRSARSDLTEDARTYWSTHPIRLATLVLPVGRHHRPFVDGVRVALSEGREPFLFSIYLGLTSLPLAALGLLRRRRLAWTVLLAATVACLGALGHHTWVFSALSTVVFPLRLFRYPEKLMILVAVFWAIAVGLGIDAAGARKGRPTTRWALPCMLAALALIAWTLHGFIVHDPFRELGWLAGGELGAVFRLATARDLAIGGTLAIAALLASLVPSRSRLGILVAIAALDLAVAHQGLHRTAERELLAYRPEILRQIENGGAASRVFVYDYLRTGRGMPLLGQRLPYAPKLGPAGWSFDESRALVLRQCLIPPTANGWGLRTGFEADFKRLASIHRSNLFSRAILGTGPELARVLRAGGVTHAISLHENGMDGLEHVVDVATFGLDPARLWRIPDPIPRIHVVGASRHATDDIAALDLLTSGAIDPHREVVLADGPTTSAGSDFVARVDVIAETPNEIEASADLSHPGYLVVADSYDPGWHALVDARPAPLLRANVGYRAVALPAGRHSVVLFYRPRALVAGLVVSLAAAIGLALAWTIATVRRRR